MLKKIVLGFVLTCSASVALAQEQKMGGVINAVIQPEPPGLMLAMIQNGPTQMVSGNIFEGLLRYSPKLEPLPGLAESWTVGEDAKTYSFKLKSGVTWHDGKPFTSADVLFTIGMLKETHSRARNNLTMLEKVEAPDDLTVVFTLKQPFGPFLGIFEVGSMPIMPKHIYEGTDWKTNPYNNAPVGTGPFMFKEWQKGSFIHLVKNPAYHEKGKPYLDDVYWQIIPDAAARSVAYETGKVDVSWSTLAGMLYFNWAESGGPTVVPPAKLGFGSKIISSLGGHAGNTHFGWHTAGLNFTLELRYRDYPDASAARAQEAAPRRVFRGGAGRFRFRRTRYPNFSVSSKLTCNRTSSTPSG